MADEKHIVAIDADLEDLIPGFLENRVKDLQLLRDALEKNDFMNIVSIGHNLKGLGGGYGFDGISELGASIESSSKEEDAEVLTDLIRQYGEYLERLEVVYE